MECFRDFIKCKICGGSCCRIYDYKKRKYEIDNNLLDIWIEGFHVNSNLYEVKPLYDSVKVHIDRDEIYINSIVSSGADIERCEYCNNNGCIIPWEYRPIQCKTFICKDWHNV